jgi:hypothetical protein
MTGRVTSDFMLVGSLPSASTEEAFATCGPLFGDSCFALPDGETGSRVMWIIDDANRLLRPHPDVETVQSPKETPPGFPDWVPGHLWDMQGFRVKPGITALTLGKWPRMDEAIESYATFRKFRDDGVIPEGVRFQIGLPSPCSAVGMFFRDNFDHDYPIMAAAYVDLVERELARLFQTVPAEDIAIQWDVAADPLDQEGVLAWASQDSAWHRYADPIPRISKVVPEEALLGFHLCYGTFPAWPMFETADMSVAVRMANEAVASAGRAVDFLHIAGPTTTRSQDDRFFKPLEKLQAGDARVFLGLAMNIDGAVGLKLREKSARRYLADFGVANYCGFGRQPGIEPEETLRAHKRLVDAFRS